MNTIPLIKTYLPPRDILISKLEEILYSGYIAQGEAVDKFEYEFTKFIGNKYSLSVNSGSSALHIALILAGVQSGDEVISTPITAEPTNTVIKQTGAKIVWADIDPNTGNIDPGDVERKITNRTKAIMVVDYAGIPVNIARFLEIEKNSGVPVIEDAAHALGASFNGELLGNHFRYTAYSFQAIKHLTTIDGGMLGIKSNEEFEKAKLIRWFGISKGVNRLENDIKLQGYKYHMNNVNATIGLVQLEGIEQIIDKYIQNGQYFDNKLNHIPGTELMKYYEGTQPSYWLYTMKVEKREDFVRMMTEQGIMVSELHKRNDFHSIFNESKVVLPNVDEFTAKMVHIPCGWWVNNEDRERMVSIIKNGW
jgi:perosamine synthetase